MVVENAREKERIVCECFRNNVVADHASVILGHILVSIDGCAKQDANTHITPIFPLFMLFFFYQCKIKEPKNANFIF